MKDYPKVSIIIPALNEEVMIKGCLESIKRLDYPKNRIEVIVVDNGSTDSTANIAKMYVDKLLYEPEATVAKLRNLGAKMSSGEILAFTDADCLVPRDWLREAIEILADEKVGAVGGGCTVPSSSSWIEKAWASEQKSPSVTTNALPASNFIILRELFDQLGGFNEELAAGEDDELSVRIMKAGYKLVSKRACTVIHLGYPNSLLGVARRQMWHARNTIEARRKMTDKMFFASHTFAICLILLPVVSVVWRGNYLLESLPLITILLVCVGSAYHRSISSKFGLYEFIKFFQLVPIFLSFFIGRSMGLLLNYFDIIKRFCRGNSINRGKK